MLEKDKNVLLVELYAAARHPEHKLEPNTDLNNPKKILKRWKISVFIKLKNLVFVIIIISLMMKLHKLLNHQFFASFQVANV